MAGATSEVAHELWRLRRGDLAEDIGHDVGRRRAHEVVLLREPREPIDDGGCHALVNTTRLAWAPRNDHLGNQIMCCSP